nr:SymE family type I addiction module toxin [Dickeya chrysanthemi]
MVLRTQHTGGGHKTFPVRGLKHFRAPLPQLTLKGRWLEDLGFNTEQPVIRRRARAAGD